MKAVSLVFPHQLFENNPCLKTGRTIIMVEEFLFFKQYKFHQQKICYHRASMMYYAGWLKERGFEVIYIDSSDERSDIRKLITSLEKQITEIHFTDPTDNWLEKRINEGAGHRQLVKYPSPMFLNEVEELKDFFSKKKRFFQADFYIHQRKKRKILLEINNLPAGGKWSFDEENRQKYPKKKIPPELPTLKADAIYEEAYFYTQKHFGNNPGVLTAKPLYPYTHIDASLWLQRFLEERFAEFGAYEDAIVASEKFLHHSVLTPMMNTGLLLPSAVVSETLSYAEAHNISLNSVEGFIRQVIGWREFIRALYEIKGSEARTTNYWQFTRKIPPSFWNGTTGIEPVDIVIRKVLETGFCHHIERLMVLGNFMLLCEFDPDDVYRWFMELFIDAYDWVMVPNVYSMSQFADGGIMATKPYISGSNYLFKMSDFPKGNWSSTWDALFWSFMNNHRETFAANPRMGMLLRTYDKMDAGKKEGIEKTRTEFLDALMKG
jgi:deoxyribodipyrimidine photolyase-related protein